MSFSYQQEINRKLIHLSSVIYPILYVFIDKFQMLWIFSIVLFILLVWEISRLKAIPIKFLRFLDYFIKPKEKECRLSGATYFLLAIFLTVLLFNKTIAILAMLILVFCDTAAALIGRKFGKIKILDKSLEGLLAFIISGILVIWLYFFIFSINIIYFVPALIALTAAAFTELISNKIKIDDNLSVILVFATLLNLWL
ncbi:Cytidylyltransferase family protein [Candidatus Hepatincolaceae symbiont of Richtersius coronifer]